MQGWTSSKQQLAPYTVTNGGVLGASPACISGTISPTDNHTKFYQDKMGFTLHYQDVHYFEGQYPSDLMSNLSEYL